MKSEIKRPFFVSGIFPALVSWEDFFGNQNPIELEIGMGRSHYLFERAQAVPHHNVVGIEWKSRWVQQANDRKIRDGVANLCAIHGNAWMLAPALFGPDTLSNITLNFPDPWWKKRHQKRRIINDAFVDVLVSRLHHGGTIFLQTDVALLFEEYLDRLEAHPMLINTLGPRGQYQENPMQARSHREKKCTELGISVYRALLVKK